ncbi:acidic mammalian chitinase-like [Canna indica]|uniref:Acidic mammalian chitinase-like n=1 Tax=Canna indica TaxID=4628 RepID=A0AAQ3KHQ0_9LILI|nr:acidic mammalian chitinase-like [Canna indica]
MAGRERNAILFFSATFFFTFMAASSSSAPIKAGYWPTWTVSYSPPSSIDLSLFTHVFYAFVQVDSATFQLNVTAADDRLLKDFSAAIHAHGSPVKALLSIGGGDSDSAFAALAAGPDTRSAFIESTIAVARRYGLEGLDLDWEFPKDDKEMADFGKLLLEWNAAAASEAAATGRPRLLLTAAVYFAPRFFLSRTPQSYPAKQMAVALDWINAMCYDFHGSWDTTATGEHAALYDPRSNISTSYGLKSWIAAGMPAAKVAMGMPMYGRTWRLSDPSQHGVGAPAAGVGLGEKGVLIYAKVVEFNRNNSATVVHDEATVAAYSYAGTSWVGYDDPWSVTRKVEYARQLGIGGYFFWAIGYDDGWNLTGTAWRAWGY